MNIAMCFIRFIHIEDFYQPCYCERLLQRYVLRLFSTIWDYLLRLFSIIFYDYFWWFSIFPISKNKIVIVWYMFWSFFNLIHRYFRMQILNKTIHKYKSSHQRCSEQKGVPRNFTKFTGKHLCQSLFLNKVAGLFLLYN